ncbi:uncharacterized protein DS421_18g609080 [Arachis hypogaea]|nr:uncharacterized protein DS421_18g609080 [Arachis hypogaea]
MPSIFITKNICSRVHSRFQIQKRKLPQIQARYSLVDFLSLHHRLRPTPPPATTIAYPLSLPSSLSSPFFHFFVPACDIPVRGVTLYPRLQAPTSNHQRRRLLCHRDITTTPPPLHSSSSFHQCRFPSPVSCLSFLYFHCFLILFLEILVRLRFVKTCVSGLKLLLIVSL